jgi:hypothetical protein
MRVFRSWSAALSLVLVVSACGTSDPTDAGSVADDQSTSAAPEATPEETTMATAPPEECAAESKDRYQGRALVSVTEPCSGDAVTSPLAVAGEANVFEATVSMRILDENGEEIATAFTTAKCGTGCWGAFVGEISFEVDHEQPGTLEVFESSAEDGSDIHKVSIPVTLVP